MPSLHDIQQEFARAILDPAVSADFSQRIMFNGLNVDRRIQIYRNNIFISKAKALSATYPVIQRLVGEAFFRMAAQQYSHSYPSRSGNLDDYGGEFADFLVRLPGIVALPYLFDVARLEWAIHEVTHAAERAPMDPASLKRLTEDQYGNIRFRLCPASRLLRSDFPILRIWQVNQQDYSGELGVDLDEGGVFLLLLRRDDGIEMHSLPEDEYEMLLAFDRGTDLSCACERALEINPDFGLSGCLSHHVLLGTLDSWHLVENSPVFES